MTLQFVLLHLAARCSFFLQKNVRETISLHLKWQHRFDLRNHVL